MTHKPQFIGINIANLQQTASISELYRNSTAINKIISFFIFLKFKALQSYGELTGKRENAVFQKRQINNSKLLIINIIKTVKDFTIFHCP